MSYETYHCHLFTSNTMPALLCGSHHTMRLLLVSQLPFSAEKRKPPVNWDIIIWKHVKKDLEKLRSHFQISMSSFLSWGGVETSPRNEHSCPHKLYLTSFIAWVQDKYQPEKVQPQRGGTFFWQSGFYTLKSPHWYNQLIEKLHSKWHICILYFSISRR